MKGKYYWAVVARSDGRIIPCFHWPRKPAIFSSKDDAVKERNDRYTFQDQKERETVIKRVLVA